MPTSHARHAGMRSCDRWASETSPLPACRDALGCWGWIEAYRDSDDPPFDEDDLDLLGDVGSSLASALRRNAMSTTEGPIIEPAPPGMIVLDRHLRPVSWTRGARGWIDALPSASLFARWSMLPSAVYPAATLARSGSGRTQARALVHAEDGRWVMIEAACLEGERDGEIAVNLRSATSTETFGLLCRVYALSRREREVVALLADVRLLGRRRCVPRRNGPVLSAARRCTRSRSRRIARHSRAASPARFPRRTR